MAVPGRSEESARVANLFVESVHIPKIIKICTIELASVADPDLHNLHHFGKAGSGSAKM